MDASRLRLDACGKERVLEILRKRMEAQKQMRSTLGPYYHNMRVVNIVEVVQEGALGQ
jgi:hypothetical protein